MFSRAFMKVTPRMMTGVRRFSCNNSQNIESVKTNTETVIKRVVSIESSVNSALIIGALNTWLSLLVIMTK